MKIVHPTSAGLVSQRNLLLQASLRPEPLPFPIEDEYPIVLSPQAHELSYCATKDDRVIAHANLWPRVLSTHKGNTQLKVGLIGNVATHADWRGKGIMAELLGHVHDKAKQLSLDAVILWSDLQQFYQKLGYRSLGKEYRLYFNIADLRKQMTKAPRQFFPIDPNQLTDEDLQAIEALRYEASATIGRTRDEFLQLLTIPATQLFASAAQGQIKGYCIVGKGYDMQGVIHEWGGSGVKAILAGLRDVANALEQQEVILLCPGNLSQPLLDELAAIATRVESHPMALVLPLTPEADAPGILEDCFIWGLDSI